MSPGDDRAIAGLVAAGPIAVAALALLDGGAWRLLLDALLTGALGPTAPPAFVATLRRENTLSWWVDTAGTAVTYNSIDVSSVGTVPAVRRHFRTWLTAGLPPIDPDQLEARLADVDEHPGHGVVRKSRALVADVLSLHGGSALHRRVLLVHAGRCLEDALWDEALTTATQAQLVAVSVGGADRYFEAARRLRAAALIGKLELQDGFDLLAQAWRKLPVLASSGEAAARASTDDLLTTPRTYDILDPLDAALRRVAFLAQRVTIPDADDDWRAAMRTLARALDHGHKPLARLVLSRAWNAG